MKLNKEHVGLLRELVDNEFGDKTIDEILREKIKSDKTNKIIRGRIGTLKENGLLNVIWADNTVYYAELTDKGRSYFDTEIEEVHSIKNNFKGKIKKDDILISSFLKEYKMIEKCGEGGNSNVYKVKDREDNLYAIKVLKKDLSSEKLKRFKNEMFFCMRTSFTNIISIVDNGLIQIDDKPIMFYVMPYYEYNLRDVINGNYSEDDYLVFFMQILKAVKYIHDKKMFHRDIKPENILLDVKENMCKLADFGIAHFHEEDLYTAIETKATSKMANFEYSAPEQKRKGEMVTYKADIYALGLILNELYTKKVPIGSGYKLISDVSNKYAFLDKIVEKMIKQNPEDRFNSLEEVEREIEINLKIQASNEILNELENIKLQANEENDILILEPPRIIKFDYDKDAEDLKIYLDKSVNELWIDCLGGTSYKYMMGFDINQFKFNNNEAKVHVPLYQLDNVQEIIDYFKDWVKNANNLYPEKVKKNIKLEKIKKEEELKRKIEKEEKINALLKSVKI